MIDVQLVHIAVRDLDRATEFYRRLLKSSLQLLDAGRWSHFQIGRTKFSLASVGEAAAMPGTTTVMFKVDRIDEATTRIEVGGGSIISKREGGRRGQIVTCSDPFGARFQIFGNS
jgi:predicted enzyme related to lactoylglutathione lyase